MRPADCASRGSAGVVTLPGVVREKMGRGVKNWLLLSGLLFPMMAAAQDCPNAGNLVQNCGFNSSVAGYTPQEPGDAIVHVTGVGATALGAMRVTDTTGDAGFEAEAETCVNAQTGDYRLAASFRAIAADTCLVGFDEFTQPDCLAPNGTFVAGTAVAVNTSTFTRINADVRPGAAVQSIEIVLLCASSQASAQFDVDDVALISLRLFANGFE